MPLLVLLPLGLMGLMVAGGCGAAPPVSRRGVAATDYDRTYRAAVEVLRDMGFETARQEYRFGRITTEPLPAPTLFEPWKRTSTTLGQRVQGTVADVRRRVVVNLEPEEGGGGGFEMEVRVELQRRQVPTRRLSASVGRSVFSDLDAVPPEWRERDVAAASWRTFGRDEYLEARIGRAIQRRMLGPTG